MTSGDIEKVNKIIIDLLLEFQNEQNRIQVLYDNGTSRLAELEEDIISYKDSEDVDFKVFSPRNVSTLNEDKLLSMDREKSDIEASNKELNTQLSYYSEKVEKLRTVLSILDDNKDELIDEELVEDSHSFTEITVDDDEDMDEKVLRIKRLFSANPNDDVLSSVEVYKSYKKPSEDITEKKDVLTEKEAIEKSYTERLVNRDKVVSKDKETVNTVSTENNYSDDLDNLSDLQKISLSDDLNRISHRLEISYKIIENDVFRTKMELKSIKNNVDDIIRSI